MSSGKKKSQDEKTGAGAESAPQSPAAPGDAGESPSKAEPSAAHISSGAAPEVEGTSAPPKPAAAPKPEGGADLDEAAKPGAVAPPVTRSEGQPARPVAERPSFFRRVGLWLTTDLEGNP